MKNTILLRSSISMVSLLMLSLPLPSWSAQKQAEVSFKGDIQPILHDYCLSCHSPGGQGYEKSGLDMRSYDSLMKGTKFGSVLKPGDSFTSIFIQVVDGRVHSSIKMPFGMNGGLAKDKIELMKRWVDQGAKNN